MSTDCTGWVISPFEKKAAAVQFQHLESEIVAACSAAVASNSASSADSNRHAERGIQFSQYVEWGCRPRPAALATLSASSALRERPCGAPEGEILLVSNSGQHSDRSDEDNAPVGEGGNRLADASLSFSLPETSSEYSGSRCYSSPVPSSSIPPSILSLIPLRLDLLDIPHTLPDPYLMAPLSLGADSTAASSPGAQIRLSTSGDRVLDPITPSSSSSFFTPSDGHPTAISATASPQTNTRLERTQAIGASGLPRHTPTHTPSKDLPLTLPNSSRKKSPVSPLTKSSLSGRTAWCGSVNLSAAPSRSPSPSKVVSALSEKVERLNERLVQAENEKTAVQVEYQRQLGLQHLALQQLHSDRSAAADENEKLKSIIFDLHMTIEENRSDLSSLRVGEEKAEEEINRLHAKCDEDRAAMTAIVAENLQLKQRVKALRKAKKSMADPVKNESISVKMTAETISDLKAVLSKKLLEEEESLLLTADRGTDDSAKHSAEKKAENILSTESAATMKHQSDLARKEYQRALGISPFSCYCPVEVFLLSNAYL